MDSKNANIGYASILKTFSGSVTYSTFKKRPFRPDPVAGYIQSGIRNLG
jgi:hypothetical protein